MVAENSSIITRWPRVLLLGIAGMLAVLLVAAPTAPASAAVTSCSRTSCTVYFSQSETRAIAQSRIPALPGGHIGGAVRLLLSVYQVGAKIAASRGQCTAFTVTLVPWQTNGYYPYNCNWR